MLTSEKSSSSSSSPSTKKPEQQRAATEKSNNNNNKRVEIQKGRFGNSLVASREYKPGDIIFRETPFAFGEGAEDAECYFSFIQRAIGKTIQTIKKTDLRGTTRDEKMREMKRTFADLTVMRELDYDRAILRDELIANKFYTSMRGHSILEGGFEVDDIVGIVNRCTLNSFRVKTLTRKDVVILTPQAYRSMEAADLVDAYIEIGEEVTLAVGVFVMASALNHSCLPNAFASFTGEEEEERRLEREQQRQREEESDDEFSARRDAGPSTSTRREARSETAQIFTTSEDQNRITIRACKPIRKGEEITVSYGPIFHSGNIDERRTELKRTHQFICRCPTCLSEAAKLGAEMESKMLAAKQKEKVVGDLIHNYVESGKYETREVLEAISKFNLDIRKMQVFGKACFDIAAQLVQAEQFAYACEYQTLALHSLILRCEGIDEDDISIAWEILRLLFVKRLVKYRGGVGAQHHQQTLDAGLVMKDSDLIARGKRILKKYYGKKYPYELFLQLCAKDLFEG